ncbi:MAG TPA: amidohydrolase [Phototrophicaceae bacterium]|jgi:5-methylthioadenosine/S-adenosylhomocysteine deaminase|nr:amidohydrolase [Phototrophicaceae bacterium]
MSDLLIQNALVLQISDDITVSTLPAHDILIKGNRIEAIQPTGKANPSRFKQVIQANGMVAMPGLINTHAHVPMVIFRGLAEDVTIEKWFNDYMWPLESNLQAEDVYRGMQLGLIEMIEAGVTSVADHYFFMDEAAKAVEEVGTRALLGWAMFGSNGMQQIDETAAFIQRWQGAGDGRITGILAPHSPYLCDDDFLRACVRKAEQLGVGIHIHAAETMQQTESSMEKRGLTPIQVLEQTGVLNVPTILAHLCGATMNDIDLLSSYPAGVAHAPKTYLKLAMGFAPVTELRAAGIGVGLATDGAVSNNTMDIWESLRLMAMTQKERSGTPETMPIAEALYIATRESARVYGLPDELGDLAPGKLADVILVDVSGTHHQPLHNIPATLVYNTRASDVQTVICNGKVVMQDRQILTLNKADVIAQVRQKVGRLSQRVPTARIQLYNP